jgi:AcrR family transcriptional regulator
MVDLLSMGALQSGAVSAARDPGPRARLLASTQKLTAQHGVGIGVDAILDDAAVARRSLYQHFEGKDGLIAASLRESAAQDEARYRAALDRGGRDPRRRILAVFDQLDETISARGFNGCRYIAAELALTDPNHPAHEVTRDYTERLHALFADELTALGHPDPRSGADQILVLIDGSLVLGAIRPGSAPARTVRALVEQILDTKETPASRRRSRP